LTMGQGIALGVATTAGTGGTSVTALPIVLGGGGSAGCSRPSAMGFGLALSESTSSGNGSHSAMGLTHSPGTVLGEAWATGSGDACAAPLVLVHGDARALGLGSTVAKGVRPLLLEVSLRREASFAPSIARLVQFSTTAVRTQEVQVHAHPGQ
jgi:hypothetical protein